MTISADLAEWKRTSALLKAADKKVARAIRKGLREAAMPIGVKAALFGSAAMPHRGGLSAYLAANAKPRISLTGSTIAIKLQDRRGVKLKAIDAGKLRHPLFGNRRKWFLEDVPVHAFTDEFEAQKDDASKVIMNAVQDALNKLEGASE